MHYIVLKGSEFTFDLQKIAKFDALLDKVENSEGPGVLVTVATSPRIYSTGFDLKFWALNEHNAFISNGRLA